MVINLLSSLYLIKAVLERSSTPSSVLKDRTIDHAAPLLRLKGRVDTALDTLVVPDDSGTTDLLRLTGIVDLFSSNDDERNDDYDIKEAFMGFANDLSVTKKIGIATRLFAILNNQKADKDAATAAGDAIGAAFKNYLEKNLKLNRENTSPDEQRKLFI